jgi:ABC-type transport system involved in multi-copper enzyme maturation permease subunit
MNWLLWRQHRLQWAIAAVALVGFALPIVITGRARSGCTQGNPCVVHITGVNIAQTLVNLSVAVPVLIGAFWGAILVGRELETGTAGLVWTQSISRRRWLRGKIATLFISAILAAAAVSALVAWWARPGTPNYNNRFEAIHFDTQGVVPVAYAVFAAALGLAAGVLFRRALPAMATTVGGFLAVRLVVELAARPHYMTPVTRFSSMKGEGSLPFGALSISNGIALHGHVVSGPISVPDSCAGAVSRQDMDACMQRAGYVLRSVFQPANRYWTFQWIEFGIFAVLAVLLVAAAVLVLRRRDA